MKNERIISFGEGCRGIKWFFFIVNDSEVFGFMGVFVFIMEQSEFKGKFQEGGESGKLDKEKQNGIGLIINGLFYGNRVYRFRNSLRLC